ncbi:MAG TPA: hypothetical protein VHE30_06640 [Polyangiaceae bacterium]|nr:hypothetical protein [Polyangiaceae bacterium]
MPERRKSSLPKGVVIGGAAVVALAGALLAFRGRGGGDAPAGSAASADSATPSLEALLAGSAALGDAPPTAPARADLLKKASVTEAISVTRPLMTNTAGRLDPGSALLAIWASDHLTWDALSALPETSPALFRKDPEAERGRRLCMSGVIVEIRAEKSLAGRLLDDHASPLIARPASTIGSENEPAPIDSAAAPSSAFAAPDLGVTAGDWTIQNDGKVFVAVLKEKPEPPPEGSSRELRRMPEKDPLVVEVLAVKSSGALVDGSEARACGILTGVTQAATSSSQVGADVTIHRIVGMFDLPQNHAGPPEIAHQGG